MPVYEYDGVRPTMADECWVAPSADVIGNAYLGIGVTVWFRAVVRADNAPIRIGDGSNIQDGAMLHADPGAPLTIGCNVTVGHHAILHGCTIEDEVLIGMGATVLDGAVIGKGSILGAGSLVTAGKVFEPGSLIMGSPAKGVRTLTDEQIRSIRASAADYRAKGAKFRNELRVLPA